MSDDSEEIMRLGEEADYIQYEEDEEDDIEDDENEDDVEEDEDFVIHKRNLNPQANAKNVKPVPIQIEENKKEPKAKDCSGKKVNPMSDPYEIEDIDDSDDSDDDVVVLDNQQKRDTKSSESLSKGGVDQLTQSSTVSMEELEKILQGVAPPPADLQAAVKSRVSSSASSSSPSSVGKRSSTSRSAQKQGVITSSFTVARVASRLKKSGRKKKKNEIDAEGAPSGSVDISSTRGTAAKRGGGKRAVSTSRGRAGRKKTSTAGNDTSFWTFLKEKARRKRMYEMTPSGKFQLTYSSLRQVEDDTLRNSIAEEVRHLIYALVLYGNCEQLKNCFPQHLRSSYNENFNPSDIDHVRQITPVFRTAYDILPNLLLEQDDINDKDDITMM